MPKLIKGIQKVFFFVIILFSSCTNGANEKASCINSWGIDLGMNIDSLNEVSSFQIIQDTHIDSFHYSTIDTSYHTFMNDRWDLEEIIIPIIKYEVNKLKKIVAFEIIFYSFNGVSEVNRMLLLDYIEKNLLSCETFDLIQEYELGNNISFSSNNDLEEIIIHKEGRIANYLVVTYRKSSKNH